MTLIIAARTKAGAAVIADKRNTIKAGGLIRKIDNLYKIKFKGDVVVFNHGYNQINGKFWAESDVPLDVNAQLFEDLLSEMKSKADKTAMFVFVRKDATDEIKIDASPGATPPITRTSLGRLVWSGDGKLHLNVPSHMRDDVFWEGLSPGQALCHLKDLFVESVANQTKDGGTRFSDTYDVEVYEW